MQAQRVGRRVLRPGAGQASHAQGGR
jgi:hypothetical protein